jgi:5-methylcytosine-specific restriction enzyme B
MTPQAQTEAGLERIWRHGILPLLEEHYLGAGVDVEQRFGLQALRRSVVPDESSAVTDSTAGDVGGTEA